MKLCQGVLVAVLLATGCSDSGSSDAKDSSKGSNSEAPTRTVTADCGQLPNEPVETKGEMIDLAQLIDSGSNVSFDPAVVQTVDETQITTSVWDGLTDFDFSDKCSPELKGLLADEFSANEDASVWTFHIRDDAVFSNGEKITPSTFKASWERAGSAEVASPYGYLIAYVKGGAALQDGSATTLDEVEADDESGNLIVPLEAPNSDFAAIASHTFFHPVSQEDRDRLGNTSPGWGENGAMIGNGPFKIESANESEVVLVPNEKWLGNVYGDTETNLSKLTFKSTESPEVAYQAFTAGEGQTATIPSGQYEQARSTYKNTIESPLLGTYYFDFGDDDPQLGGKKNVKLRQAISLAINRQEINEKVYENARPIASGITPPGIPGYTPELCDYCTLDVKQAKKLYKEWKDAGNELTDPIKVDYNEGGSHGDTVQIIISNLKKNLGIDAVAAPISDNYFRDVAKEGGCHLCRTGWQADYPTYGNFMVDLFGAISIGGNNFARFDNPEFESLIEKAQKETDAETRAGLYQDAERLLLNKSTSTVPINWYTGDQVYADNVVNFDQPPSSIILWERVGLK